MSDNVDAILSMSQRVLRLREELAKAEAQLQGLVHGSGLKKKRGRPPKSPLTSHAIGSTPSPPHAPVTQRVAKALARGPLNFGDLFKAVQPAKRGAVKSALNVGRENGEYELRGGKYQYKKKPPGSPFPGAQ